MKVNIAYRLTFFSFCVALAVIIAQPHSLAQTKYKVAWQSMVDEEFQIFIMDLANPSQINQVTSAEHGCKHPSLMTNGKRIYYYRFYPTNWGDGDQLFYIDLAENKERLVQRNAIHTENDPCISRDGNTLAYRSKQTLPGVFDTANWEIVCLRTDFSVANRVTTDIDDELDPFLNGDGSQVYFTVEVVKERTETEKNELRDAAEEADEEIDEETDEFNEKLCWYIWRNSFEGDNLERVTPRDYNAWHPSVSADEHWMVFVSDMDGNEEIYLMDLTEWEIERLTDSEGYDGNPCISSDGEVIVFVSDRDGDKEIFSMNRLGQKLVQLTDNDVEDDNPFIT